MTAWQIPVFFPCLDRYQVHIWCANLNLPPADVARLTDLLSVDEIARANKFRFPRHKRRFIVARGILRQLLGNYLDINPKNIEFNYGDCGKPEIAGLNKVNPLQFNISHSQECALFGFSLDSLIGVDLEYLREMPDAVKIAQRFFSARESDLIDNLDQEQQSQTFFQLWTAKEAYLKAIGKGLSGSLASVEISFDSVSNQTLLSAIDGNTAAVKNWSIYSCLPESNYIGAIAVNLQIAQQQINFWHWQQNL